ncbi:hypothetical protein N7462_001687 [Penicillium macrosclerotiorum]|uniref:uncharacterized protein n=1 Tax=Penicillium macrosclerotiorum TaxID=303699 RepID=UPI00254694F5|nr:uncharacterized protein N7462_001687 [Penicillium macrosclerotiorum]KAJ5692264.1 hypothetical protein N7462_001687 [Penicillium macrosclerotiorum]
MSRGRASLSTSGIAFVPRHRREVFPACGAHRWAMLVISSSYSLRRRSMALGLRSSWLPAKATQCLALKAYLPTLIS